MRFLKALGRAVLAVLRWIEIAVAWYFAGIPDLGFMGVFANSGQAQITYVKESVWGTTPGSPSMLKYRFTSANLNLKKTKLVSEERRSDGQIPFVRQGMHKVDGTIDSELSYLALKDWIAVALRYDPTKVLGKVTGGPTITTTTTTIVRGAGSFITDGFVAGMMIRVTGANLPANNGLWTIASVVALTLTMTAAVLTTDAVGNATTKINGNYVANGVIENSFSVEMGFTDIAQYEVFTGIKPDGFTIDAKTDAIATFQAKVIGKDSSVSGVTLGAPTDVDVSQPADTYEGTISLGGAASTIIMSFQAVATWARKGSEVLGQNTIAQIIAGRLELSGKMDIYFQDLVALNLFRNETQTSIQIVFQDPAGNQFILNIPAVKFTDAGKQVKGSDAIMLGVAWEAFLDTVSGTTVQVNMVPAIAT